MKTTQTTVVETKVEETNGTITHFFAIDEDTDWPLSILVGEAIETVADQPTNEIEPLAHCVDPDALDDLFTDRWNGGSRAAGEVTFTMDRYRVTVLADDRITVTEPA